MLDIAKNCLDDNVRHAVLQLDIPIYFHIGELQNAPALMPPADIGYCCDVLEHLPTDQVPAALAAINALTPRAYMTVCHMKDGFGSRINDVLHMTVRDHDWWFEQIRQAWPKHVLESTPSRSTSVYEVEVPS